MNRAAFLTVAVVACVALAFGVGTFLGMLDLDINARLDEHDARLDRLESTTTVVVRPQGGEPSRTTTSMRTTATSMRGVCIEASGGTALTDPATAARSEAARCEGDAGDG